METNERPIGPPARLYRVKPVRNGNDQVYTYNWYMQKWRRMGSLWNWERMVEVQVGMGIAAWSPNA
jgi:hypothetical protein